MKTMTCRQMGGPCDTAIQGNTAEELMANGAAHLDEMAGKDEGHKKAQEMMAQMQANPDSGKDWNEKFMADFAALPEDQ